MSLTDVESALKNCLDTIHNSKTKVLNEVLKMLHWFAGRQIRNVATIGGNIMTSSPISDLSPIFMASQSQLEILGHKMKPKTVLMDDEFFVGYRKNVLKPHQVVGSVLIPFTQENVYFVAYKQSRRREDDIAIVNGAFWYKLDNTNNNFTFDEARIAFGGLGPTTMLLDKTTTFLTGKPWSEKVIEESIQVMMKEVRLPQMAPGGMVEYRQVLAGSLTLKSFFDVSMLVSNPGLEIGQPFLPEFKSSQLFETGRGHNNPIGKPIKHSSADLHATGEAKYVDDLPRLENELFLGFVLSTEAHAKILEIDASKALAMTGVVGFFSSEDLTEEENRFSTSVVNDEVLFAEGTVECVGQVIGLVVANDQDLATKAANQVKVCYQSLTAVLSIEDAIEVNSYFPAKNSEICVGDLNQGFRDCDQILTGTFRTGGQEHFYMETQCCLAIPTMESGEIEIFSATQNPTEVQRAVAGMLQVGMHKVTSRARRLGGGFGGKETRCVPFALATAFVAAKMGQPVRFMLDRDQDMIATGTRHPMLGKYKVGFNTDGTIQALDAQLYFNAGYTTDLSVAVMERGITHIDNSYRIKNLKVKGYCCKTNLQSNTAFRGFGAPQAMMLTEVVMDDVASKLKVDTSALRRLNMYDEGDVTFINQPLDHCTLSKCWDECQQLSNYSEALADVKDFNTKNRWTKRGISMVPVKFGVSFGAKFLNQGGALVHIYKDGSVLLSHAGVEMGQGLHTKTIQVASTVFGIPLQDVHVLETNTAQVRLKPH